MGIHERAISVKAAKDAHAQNVQQDEWRGVELAFSRSGAVVEALFRYSSN